jgi:hypothetical protein
MQSAVNIFKKSRSYFKIPGARRVTQSWLQAEDPQISFDDGKSVHHSIIHKENPTRCNSVSKFYFIFI